MPSLRGSLVHVGPVPKKSKFKSAHDAFKNSPRRKRAKHKIDEAVGNATSRKGRVTYNKGRKGWSGDTNLGSHDFGKTFSSTKETRTERRFTNANAALLGGGMGILGGSAATTGGSQKRQQELVRNSREINRNKKKLVEKGFRMPRTNRHLITDLGTRGAKANEKADYGTNHPGHYGIGGIAVGAGLGGTLGVAQRKAQKKKIKEQRAVLANQKKKLQPVAKYDKIPNQVPKEKRGKLAWTGEDSLANATDRGKRYMSAKKGAPYAKENRQIRRNHLAGGTAIGTAGGAALATQVPGGRPRALVTGFGAAYGALMGKGTGDMRRGIRAGRRNVNQAYKKGEVRAPRKDEKVNFRGMVVSKSAVSAFGVDHG